MLKNPLRSYDKMLCDEKKHGLKLPHRLFHYFLVQNQSESFLLFDSFNIVR
jgi:hypothetical protein